MEFNYEIKNGLSFQLVSSVAKLESTSILRRNDDGVSLAYVFAGFDCSLDSGGENHFHEITFNFQNSFLRSFGTDEDDFLTHSLPLHQQFDICCNSQMILHDIINCSLKGVSKNMFLESKALALFLCFQKCQATTQFSCESCKFLTKPTEKEKIFKVKEIILNSLNNPPTIQEISLSIGMNQCYLKKGFKEIFGTTVYEFVQEQRMLKAKLLLSTTDSTVSQVADCIGFSSPSNFSLAFKKFTGVFPSELRQN